MLVQRRRRLIQEQHLGLQRQRPGQHHTLLLAHREPARLALGVGGRQPRELERTRRVHAPADQGRPETDVVRHGPGQGRGQLGHEARSPPQRPRVQRSHVLAVEADGAGVRVREAVEQPQERGLPGPRRAEERGGLRLERQVHPTQYGRSATVGGDVAELEER